MLFGHGDGHASVLANLRAALQQHLSDEGPDVYEARVDASAFTEHELLDAARQALDGGDE